MDKSTIIKDLSDLEPIKCPEDRHSKAVMLLVNYLWGKGDDDVAEAFIKVANPLYIEVIK